MRLDTAVAARYSLSREKSKELILTGAVSVSGKTVSKPSASVGETDEIVLSHLPDYVSRGGIKLAAALDGFGVAAEGRVCLDIGASTGGFTDCLLRHGAKKVYAVDVGTAQLDARLKNDPRVVSLEQTDIRSLAETGLPETASLAVCDVSFISLTKILPAASRLCREGIFLIKPQFELNASALNRRGIVKDEKLRRKAVTSIRETAASLGFREAGFCESPVKGKEGNTEYLIWLVAEGRQ